MPDTLQGQLIASATTFLAGIGVALISRKLDPKAKIVWWCPRAQLFELPVKKPEVKEVNSNPQPLIEQKANTDTSNNPIPKEESMVVANPAAGQPPLLILVNTIFLQNTGKKSAEAVEICYRAKPENFKLYPSFDYDESLTPDGAFILKIKSLGSRETVAIETLSFVNAPQLNYIRCSNSQCQELTRWYYQRVYPLWVSYTFISLAAIGAACVVACIVFVILNGLGIYTLPHINIKN